MNDLENRLETSANGSKPRGNSEKAEVVKTSKSAANFGRVLEIKRRKTGRALLKGILRASLLRAKRWRDYSLENNGEKRRTGRHMMRLAALDWKRAHTGFLVGGAVQPRRLVAKGKNQGVTA